MLSITRRGKRREQFLSDKIAWFDGKIMHAISVCDDRDNGLGKRKRGDAVEMKMKMMRKDDARYTWWLHVSRCLG